MLILLINHFLQLCKPNMSSSQRVLKCTVCGGNHSRLHCLVLCNSCSGDKRDCDCQSQPQKSRNTPSQSDKPEPDYKKLYSKLVQCLERVRKAFQALQEEEKREIKELNNAQELVDLVKTKHKVIEELKNSLVEARNRVSAMKEEICSLQANRAEVEDAEHGEQITHLVSTYNLENIHERYTKVLGILNKEQCSMANAFQLARCPCSTIRDFVAIAKLKIIDSREQEHVTRKHAGSVTQLELACRRCLRRYLPLLTTMRREGRLLPLTFDPRFYE